MVIQPEATEFFPPHKSASGGPSATAAKIASRLCFAALAPYIAVVNSDSRQPPKEIS
jgi:hypothetical protein